MIHFNKIAAIILAGGKGTRIGQNLPKVLYPIMGKPMIHYSLKLIEDVGLRDVRLERPLEDAVILLFKKSSWEPGMLCCAV